MLASASRQELARQINYLKTENQILRSRLPKQVLVTPTERRQLVKAGMGQGKPRHPEFQGICTEESRNQQAARGPMMPTKNCQACGIDFEAKKPQTVLCKDCRRVERLRNEDDSDQLPEMTSIDRAMSGGTTASNPGHVKVDWLHTFGSWPVYTMVTVLIAIGVGVATTFSLLQKNGRLGTAIVIGVVAGVATLLLTWIPWSRVMIYGCANPGIVVDADRGLVAVTTDLDCGIGVPFQVIKIVKQPLHRMPDGPPKNGQRVGTVAGYSGDGKQGHWNTFEPIVVGCMTRDHKVVKRVLNSFSDEDWQTLKLGLKEVPKPYKPGQWRVLEHSV
jgi:hypothetical protein